MAEYDGTIKINTKIDTKGMLDGFKNMNSKVKSLDNSVKESEKQVKQLKKELSELQNSPAENQQMNSLKMSCEDVENQMLSLLNQREVLEDSFKTSFGGIGSDFFPTQDSFNSFVSNNSEWQELTAQINNAELKLTKYEEKLKLVQATEQKKRDMAIEKKSLAYEKAANRLEVYRQKLKETQFSQSGIGKALNSLGATARKSFGQLNTSANKSNKTLSSLNKSFGRFAKRIWSLFSSAILFSVLTKAFTALREKIVETTKANAQCSASMAQIKGNMSNAFNTIMTAAMPALTSIMSAVAKATSYISAFIALLFGKTVKSSNAAASAADSTADSIGGVGDAAKKASQYLNGYDEMNVQASEDSSGGGSGGGGTSPITYDDVDVSSNVQKFLDRIKKAWADADFTEVGASIGQKLKKALEDIPWDTIKENGYKVGKSFATLLNGIFETDGLFSDIGTTIAEALNTAVQTALGFGENFHWDSAGKAIADAVNGFFRDFKFDELANTIDTWVDGIKELVSSALKNIKWGQILEDVMDFACELDLDTVLITIGAITWMFGGKALVAGALSSLATAQIATGIGTLTMSVGAAVGLAVAVAVISFKVGNYIYDHVPKVQECSDALVELVGGLFTDEWNISDILGGAQMIGFDIQAKLLNLFLPDGSKTDADKIKRNWLPNYIWGILFGDDTEKANSKQFFIDIAVNLGTKASELKEKILGLIDSAKGAVYSIGINLGTSAAELKKKIDDGWNKLSDKSVSIKASLSTKAAELKNNIQGYFDTHSLNFKAKLSTKASSIMSAFRKAWNKLAELKLKIKMPHINITYDTKSVMGKAFKKLTGSGMPKFNVKWYANGGFPDAGQMFIARENGAEMVGNINGKAGVANNEQITSAIAAAVGPAVYDAVMSALANSNSSGGDISVYVGGQKITDYVIKDVKNRTIASGGKNPLFI